MCSVNSGEGITKVSHWNTLLDTRIPSSSLMSNESGKPIRHYLLPPVGIFIMALYSLTSNKRHAHTVVFCYLIKDNQQGDTDLQKTSVH